MVWWPGNTRAVAYTVTNPEAQDQVGNWTLVCKRDWPGFPISGSVLVPALSGTDITVPVPIPDTATSGTAMLILDVTLQSSSQTLECSHTLHDFTTAALGTLAEIVPFPDHVTLTWDAGAASGRRAIVERSDDRESWSPLGDATEVGGGKLRFDDRTAARGAGYWYRLVDDHERALSAVAFVTIPAQATFALHAQSVNPASAGWTVALDLPAAGEARLELYDLSGRRLEAHVVHADAAGRKLVALGNGARVAPGVYSVVARFGGQRAQLRLVLFR